MISWHEYQEVALADDPCYNDSLMTQKEALDLLKLGYNVFLTGPAGSGKTHLLNQYIDYLQANKIPVGITASTGIAATHMGGVTIHSWSGIGIKDILHDNDISDIVKKPYVKKRLVKTKVLIIDEISMLHAHRLDLVDKVCKAFKKNDLPFGGLQVIMCGDFFQLPPVSRKDEPPAKFVTESEIWKSMHLQVCYLEEQYRQDDRSFLRVLNDIRNSDVNEVTFEYLSERLDKPVEGYVKPTRLFTHNADVDAINLQHLLALEGVAKEYQMSWKGNALLTESLKKSCLAPETLQLKIGAQVMFVKNNFDAGYVNGTLGEVIDFDMKGLPVVRTFNGDEITVTPVSWEVREESVGLVSTETSVIASISQLPIRLAWAITIHKSQGMSLDAAEIDLSRAFIPGMGYVALSRVRSLKGLKLMGMNQTALQVNSDVAEIDRRFLQESNQAVMRLHAISSVEREKKQKEVLQYFKSSGKLTL